MIGNLSKSEPVFVPTMPLKTIEGPAAWRGVDFRNRDDFACQLSDADITEIETAVQAVIQGGVAHIAIDRDNFHLPRLGNRFLRMRDEVLLRGRGFIVVRGLPVVRYSMEQAAAAFLGIGAYFGRPVSQNGKGHILGHVKDLGRTIDRPDSTYLSDDAQANLPYRFG